MQSYSSNRKRYSKPSGRNESERWSFQTDEMPGSCQSRRRTPSGRRSDVIPSHNISISGVKLKNTNIDTVPPGRPSSSRKLSRDYSGTSRILRKTNLYAQNHYPPYHGQSPNPKKNKPNWLDNLRKTTEVRVPPRAFTSRSNRFKHYDNIGHENQHRSARKSSSSSDKLKSSHQIERRRIQNLISSSNWDGSGKPDLYIFGKELGKGSFGVVKLAHHKITGQKVAIKVYDKNKFKKSSQIKRCRQEIVLMAQLKSKKVTHLFEAFENSKKIYLVMEALSGGNLCTYVKSKKYLSESEALPIFKQIAEGLHFLHVDAGVVHRDIKLENLLFTSNRRIKLADFGFSVFIDNNEENVERHGTGDTKKYLKSFCGTPSYMAPEIIRKKGYEGFPVDIWSLGVVLYAMLFGRFPFRARNHEDLYKLILSGRYSLPESLASEVSFEAKTLLKKLIVNEVRSRANISFILKTELIQSTQLQSQEKKDAVTHTGSLTSSLNVIGENPKNDLREDILKQLVRFGFSYHKIRRQVINEERNHITATYYLLRMKQARKMSSQKL